MNEITNTKEVQEKEVNIMDSVPEIAPKNTMTLQKADAIYNKLIEGGYEFEDSSTEGDVESSSIQTFDKQPDWVSENESDGQTFYGYDDGEGRTDWYDSNGNLDSVTDTPSDDECDDYLRKF